MTATVLRVLVLEDTPVMQEHLLDVLKNWSRRNEVRLAATVSDGLALVKSDRFDLLIADVRLPDGEGIEVIRALRQAQPDALAIVFSALSDKETVLRAIQAGASGYIHKEDLAADLYSAFEGILAGGSPMSAVVARLVVESLQLSPPAADRVDLHLTPRENEIIQALAKGYTNSEIAELFGVSNQTIPVHIRNIYRKLEVKSRTEAVFEARRLGLLDQ